MKGGMETFVIFGTRCFAQTMGGAFIRVVPLLGIIRYYFIHTVIRPKSENFDPSGRWECLLQVYLVTSGLSMYIVAAVANVNICLQMFKFIFERSVVEHDPLLVVVGAFGCHCYGPW